MSQMIPLILIQPNPDNPRRASDPQHITDLARSLTENGQIHPIKVRPHPTDAEQYQVVCGHQRRLAAIEAGWTNIRAEVEEMTDLQALRIMLVENSSRNAVDPLAEADAIQRLLAGGVAREDLRTTLGHGKYWMRTRLALANLGPEAREALETGRMGLTAAASLAIVDQERQRKILEGLLRWHRKISASDIQRQLAGRLLSDAIWDLDDETLTKAPSCSACPLRSDRQGDLFAENYDDAHCLDSPCWTAKQEATIERLKKAKRTRNGDAFSLASVYAHKPWQAGNAGVTDADWQAAIEAVEWVLCIGPHSNRRAWPVDAVHEKLLEMGHAKAVKALTTKPSKGSSSPKPPKPEKRELDAAQRQLAAALPSMLDGDIYALLISGFIKHARQAPLKGIAKRRMLDGDRLTMEHVEAMSATERLGVLLDLAFEETLQYACNDYSPGLDADDPWVAGLKAARISVPKHAVRKEKDTA